jgi:RHS repeat-associated protein
MPFKWVGRYGYYLDATTGLSYVRARVFRPTLALWKSTDPLSRFDITSGYVYGMNRPISAFDPSGLISVDFVECTSGAGNVRDCSGLICGDPFAIWWNFKLDKEYDCYGYVDVWCFRNDCRRADFGQAECPTKIIPTKPTFSFLEAWNVDPKKRTHALAQRQPGTDGAELLISDKECGTIIVRGEIKLFCTTDYTDPSGKVWKGIGNLRLNTKWNEIDRAFGKGSGCQVTTGTIPSMDAAENLPEWWNNSIEKSGSRHVALTWDCCCEKLKDTSFEIQYSPGANGGYGYIRYPR